MQDCRRCFALMDQSEAQTPAFRICTTGKRIKPTLKDYRPYSQRSTRPLQSVFPNFRMKRELLRMRVWFSAFTNRTKAKETNESIAQKAFARNGGKHCRRFSANLLHAKAWYHNAHSRTQSGNICCAFGNAASEQCNGSGGFHFLHPESSEIS